MLGGRLKNMKDILDTKGVFCNVHLNLKVSFGWLM
jgi:hypothetical protein